MKFRKPWLLLIVVVAAAGIGFAIYGGMLRSGDSYLTVSQVKSQAPSGERHLVVQGQVVPGSIAQDNSARTVKFVLTDGVENLEVVYLGMLPDYFSPGGDLVIVGKYRPERVFEASTIGRPGSLCNTCHQ